jgi:hypothetical protein
VLKASQADPTDVYSDDPEDWTKEGTSQYIEQVAKDIGLPVEKVEMKTRDKFYVNDSQIFTVTNKTLKCLDSKPSEFQLNEDEWEEKHNGFVVDLSNEAALRATIEGKLSTFTPAEEPVVESAEEPQEEVTEEKDEESEPVVEGVEEVAPPKTPVVDSDNLAAGFGCLFGKNGLAKIEIYIPTKDISKDVLLEKMSNFIDEFTGE